MKQSILPLLIAVFIVASIAGTPVATATEPEQKSIEANGYRFDYIEQGNGPLLIMVHGAASDMRSWETQMTMLANDFRVVSLTQRYFGKGRSAETGPPMSDELAADDLAAFIKALNSGPAHLVGLSMGSRNSHLASLRHPDVVRSAYLYEGSVPLPPPEPISDEAKAWMSAFNKAWGPVVGAAKTGEVNKAVRGLIDNVSGDATFWDKAGDKRQAIWLDNAGVLPKYFARKQTRMTCEEISAATKVPTLLVAGTRSVLAPGAPVAPLAKLRERCLKPLGEVRFIEGATHLWPALEPEKFVASVREFALSH